MQLFLSLLNNDCAGFRRIEVVMVTERACFSDCESASFACLDQPDIKLIVIVVNRMRVGLNLN